MPKMIGRKRISSCQILGLLLGLLGSLLTLYYLAVSSDNGAKKSIEKFSSYFTGDTFNNYNTKSEEYRPMIDFPFEKLNLKNKIVHLDLKGMPPKISYFKEMFSLFNKLGVTGILIEYEDMFPYHGRLKPIANKSSYTKADIKQINILASQYNLEIIPLIQTFGHMEFILKLERFGELSEMQKYPQVICPTNNKSIEIIREMIDQIMEVHPNIKIIHLGSDEIYYIGMCPLCTARMDKYEIDKTQLFLDHVKSVADYVNQKYKIRILVWDDQFRSLDVERIKESKLGNLVEVVVWNYHTDVESKIYSSLLIKYSEVFNKVWAGSAYKGADRPNTMIVNETHYLLNHISWGNVIRRYSKILNFEGLILTGWQRFDHFSVLCEILPVAIPSLTSAMFYINSDKYLTISQIFSNVSYFLDCTVGLDYCRFPGGNIHLNIKNLYKFQFQLKNMKKDNKFMGWVTRANLETSFSNPSHIENIFYEISSIKTDLERLEEDLNKSLKEYFQKWTIQEWMFTNFKPFQQEIQYLFNGLATIMDKKSFPVRPLNFPSISYQTSEL